MTEWNLHAADGSGSTIWGNPSNQAVWNETLDDIMRTVHKSMESNWSAYIWWYGKRFYSFIGDGEAAYGTTAGRSAQARVRLLAVRQVRPPRLPAGRA